MRMENGGWGTEDGGWGMEEALSSNGTALGMTSCRKAAEKEARAQMQCTGGAGLDCVVQAVPRTTGARPRAPRPQTPAPRSSP